MDVSPCHVLGTSQTHDEERPVESGKMTTKRRIFTRLLQCWLQRSSSLRLRQLLEGLILLNNSSTYRVKIAPAR